MKIYVLEFDMTLVLARLKGYKLGIFNYNHPIIFIDADNPDDACYLGYCKFAETLLKQDESSSMAEFIKEVFEDIRITKVYCKDET